MADVIAPEAGSTLLQPSTVDLLKTAIGSSTDQDINKNTTQTGTNTGTNNSTTTNNNTTQQTSNQNSTQQTSQNADISALQQVFAQQQGGITPEMLAAIFSEGSKAAPGLVAATANAVGARSSDNTPLATALTGLNAQLTAKAAQMSQDMRNASGDTAAKIADLTKTTTTTGSQDTSTSLFQNLLQSILGQTSQNTSQNTGEVTNNQTDSNPNYGNASQLIGALLGGSVLNQALPGGISGAISGLTGSLGSSLGSILKGLGLTDDQLAGLGINGSQPLNQAGSSGDTSIDELLAQLAGQGASGTTPTTPQQDTNDPSFWDDNAWDDIDWSALGI